MTHNEVNKTLIDAGRIVNTMDKEHAKALLKVLIDAQTKKDCASFLYLDIRKTVKRLLSGLVKTKVADKCLTRRQMKQIYEILGDYGYYPVCKLCGKPIKICTANHGHPSNNNSFSWDHITPKSMGGGYDLSNMQPTHKICNNKRGSKPLITKHYKLNVKIDVDIVFDTDGLYAGKNPKYNPGGFGLRKQDSWCHKKIVQRQR